MNAPDPCPLLIDDFAPTPRSLRVALVSETYVPEVNGVALTLERVVHGLSARGHDLQVVRPRQAGTDAPSAQAGLEQVLMRSLPIPNYPQVRFGLPAKGALLRLWALRRPDLVHIATEGPLGWSALQAARKLKLPLSTDFHTNFHTYSRHYGVGWLQKPIAAYLRKFHNAADCTLVPTESLKAELQAQCPQALVCGMRTGSDLAQHYASADVFVFPSQSETYGNVVPEAMASGLAVLAYDCAAAAELIAHQTNGLLAPFGDSERFVEHAQQLAVQPETVQRLRAAARARAEALDWGQIAQQTEALWLELLRGRSGSD